MGIHTSTTHAQPMRHDQDCCRELLVGLLDGCKGCRGLQNLLPRTTAVIGPGFCA